DYQAETAVSARLDAIADFYAARVTLRRAEARGGAPVYNPLPTERLYLAAGEWAALLEGRAVAEFSPFVQPPSAAARVWHAAGSAALDFAESRAQPGANLFEAVRDRVTAEAGEGRRILINGYSAGSLDRLAHLLAEHGLDRQVRLKRWADLPRLTGGAAGLAVLPLEHGFTFEDVVVHTEQDIPGERLARGQRKRRRSDRFLAELASLSEGDLVVHVEHGIGRYDGLITLEVDSAPHDCLRLIYEGNDKLFVPVENLEVLTR